MGKVPMQKRQQESASVQQRSQTVLAQLAQYFVWEEVLPQFWQAETVKHMLWRGAA